MKHIKIFAFSFALVACMAGSASAPLLGGTVESATGVTGSVSGQNGGLLGGVSSTTHSAGSVTGQNGGLIGSADSSTQAAAKAERKKIDQASPSKSNQKSTSSGIDSQMQSTTQREAAIGPYADSNADNYHKRNSARGSLRVSADTSANVSLGSSSAQVDSNSDANANAQASGKGKSGQMSTDANSSTSGDAKVSHKRHTTDDKE